MATTTFLAGTRKFLGGLNPNADADAYRAALERGAYSDAGQQYGQGLGSISNYLAGAGPLADSGAATALRARLASQIYGGVQGRVQNAYASYLGDMMRQRREYQYQMALLKQQHRYQSTGIGGVAGGLAGGLVGSALGPIGTAIGTKIGSSF